MKLSIGVLCAMLIFGIVRSTRAELIGYWSFDEGKTDIVEDHSGNGYDGIVQGEVEWVDGKFQQAIEMTTADGRIEVSDSEKLDFQEFTAAMWVQVIQVPTQMGLSAPLIQKGGPGGLDVTYVFFMGLHNSNDRIYFIVADGSGEVILWSTDIVTPGEWHFIAGTYDDKDVKVYLDGKVDETAQTLEPQKRDDRPVIIAGGNPGGFNPNKEAIYDEVLLFNHALSEEELTELMTVGPRQFLPVDARDKLTTTWGGIKEAH
jgi:hypothetical protein